MGPCLSVPCLSVPCLSVLCLCGPTPHSLKKLHRHRTALTPSSRFDKLMADAAAGQEARPAQYQIIMSLFHTLKNDVVKLERKMKEMERVAQGEVTRIIDKRMQSLPKRMELMFDERIREVGQSEAQRFWQQTEGHLLEVERVCQTHADVQASEVRNDLATQVASQQAFFEQAIGKVRTDMGVLLTGCREENASRTTALKQNLELYAGMAGSRFDAAMRQRSEKLDMDLRTMEGQVLEGLEDNVICERQVSLLAAKFREMEGLSASTRIGLETSMVSLENRILSLQTELRSAQRQNCEAIHQGFLDLGVQMYGS